MPFVFPQRLPVWRCPGGMRLFVGLISLLLSCLPALGGQNKVSRGDYDPPTSAGKGCVMLAALNPQEFQKSEFPKALQKAPRRTPEKELRRPMNEQELRLLLRAMEPVELKKGKERALRAAVEGTELPLDRMGVLLDDITALLAHLHARETLDRLAGMRDLKPEARAWMEEALQGIRGCVPDRFAERGGPPAFAQSLRLVEQFRPELENMLLESRRLQGLTYPPPGDVPWP